MAYLPRIRLDTASNPVLVTEYRRILRLQIIWRLTHNGFEHAEYYDYLIRMKEELARRNIIIINNPENLDESASSESD